MKKILFFFLLIITLFSFVGCTDPNTEQPAETQNVSAGEDSWITSSKTIWQKVVGKEFYDKDGDNIYNTIAFTENEIFVDCNKYSLTFLNETEISNLQDFEGKNTFCFINFALGTFCLKYVYLAPAGNSMDLEDTYLNYYSFTGSNYTECEIYEYKGVYNSGSGNSSLTDVTGTYSFNDASGSGQVNGNIVLNDDGTWDSNSTKLTSAISNKNYTVNGNKITFNWTANGMSVSTEVTVTDNGSSLTFEANNVNLFSMLFGVVSTSITVTKQ